MIGFVRRLLLTALTAVIAIAAVLPTALGATKTIKVGDNYFVRPSGVPGVSVDRGTTVQWRFAGRRRHNVKVTSGPVRFRSPIRRSGTYRKRIFTPGRYVIICSLHGARDQKMILRVRR